MSLAKIGRNHAVDIQEVLKCRLFAGLAREETDRVIAAATQRTLNKDEVLFRQGDPVKSTFLPVRGQIKLHQTTADGAQTLLRVIGPGQILAIVSALNILTYPATATAEREVTLLCWDGLVLDRLFLEVPHLCRNALAIVSSRVQEMQLRFGELAVERTERRLARSLLRLANQLGRTESSGVVLDLSLSRQDVAEMIGTTHFSVTRILRKWQESGWVIIGRQKVTIVHPTALIRLSEEENFGE